jgi:hypothetical protein
MTRTGWGVVGVLLLLACSVLSLVTPPTARGAEWPTLGTWAAPVATTRVTVRALENGMLQGVARWRPKVGAARPDSFQVRWVAQYPDTLPCAAGETCAWALGAPAGTLERLHNVRAWSDTLVFERPLPGDTVRVRVSVWTWRGGVRSLDSAYGRRSYSTPSRPPQPPDSLELDTLPLPLPPETRPPAPPRSVPPSRRSS